MIGKNQMTAIGDEQSSLEVNGQRLPDRLRFLDQGLRIEHDPAADDAFHILTKYSRWNEVEHVAPVADADGVSRVVAALVAGDAVVPFGKDIDDLTLSFVAPL